MYITKLCINCKQEKKASEFYKNGKFIEAKCKLCKIAYIIKVRKSRIGYYRAYDKKRSKTEKRRAYLTLRSKVYQKENISKIWAHRQVKRAIQSGSLKKPRHCEECGRAKIYAHHDDYDYPLEVIWLCAVHHSARHKELA